MSSEMSEILEMPWRLALTQARGAVGLSDPNPRVGCVLTDAQGRVIGQGHTQQAGGPHAEVMALRDAREQGHDPAGATAWVTLEPCAHHGRTPPCADALLAAGVGAVHAALADPNPLVAGQGLARLQAAGVAVSLLDAAHPAAREARELNLGFLSRMVRARPWVRVKVAASLDGRTALGNGVSQWITSPEARLDGHRWRARASALLTGIGTVLADAPRLNVREVPVQRQPWRVVLDSHWRLPADAALIGGDAATTHVFGVAPDPQAGSGQDRARLDRLRGAGLQTWPLTAAPDGRLPLPEVLAQLAASGVNELHVEAGATLTGAFVAQGLADELLVYLAPCLLGPGRDFAALPALDSLQGAARYLWHDVARVGPDLRLMLRATGADTF